METQLPQDLQEEFKEYVDTETGECRHGLLLSEEEILAFRKSQEGKQKASKYYREKTEFESSFKIISALSILITIWNYGKN